METPRFFHLVGVSEWLKCDHSMTQLVRESAAVRLATRELAETESHGFLSRIPDDEFRRWRRARGGAVALPCAPDACPGSWVMLADPNDAPPSGATGRVLQGLFQLANPGWIELRRLGEPVYPMPSSPGVRSIARFASSGAPLPMFSAPAALGRDAHGRVWMLERGANRIRVLTDDSLRLIDTIAPPPGWVLTDLCAAQWGVLAAAYKGSPGDESSATEHGVWRLRFGADWDPRPITFVRPGPATGAPPVPLDAVPVAVAAASPQDARPDRAVVLFRLAAPEPLDSTVAPPRVAHALLGVVDAAAARVFPLPGLEDPLPLVFDANDGLLVGEISRSLAEAGGAGKTYFTRFTLDEDGPHPADEWVVRGYDGRAVFLDSDGRAVATACDGVRGINPVREEFTTYGRIETFALDSATYGCGWHRVFLDVCLPPGTRVEMHARTSDDLYPEGLARSARPPLGDTAAVWDAAEAPLPLGSRAEDDDEGWISVGALDRRAAHADVPFPGIDNDVPAEALPASAPAGACACGCAGAGAGTLGASAACMCRTLRFDTLEGLLKNAPGRYLWVRIGMFGTHRRTPSVLALRATFPRPSLLDYLPAFWRRDPDTAARMERLLALFEGVATQLDADVDALPRHLFNGLACPKETLDWLAGFVALTFDQRLPEQVRRRLLMNAMTLYRRRGTPRGLEQLCSIVGRCRVQVVESFRLRRRAVTYLGAAPGINVDAGSVLGPGMQIGLGARDALLDAGDQDWEQELLRRRAELRAARAEDGACPRVLPDLGLSADPEIAFYRRSAHRFNVLIFAPYDQELDAVIESAIESAKPAHTLHSRCWLDAGFRTGVNTYVGIGTTLGPVQRPKPAIVGSAVLGARSTISRSPRRPVGVFVGASRAGRSHQPCTWKGISS